MIRRLSLIPMLLIALALAMLVPWQPATAAPDDGADDLRATLLRNRNEEAATKQRLAERWLAGAERTTPNQDAYDVLYYGLNIDLNPSTRILSGTLTVQAQVLGASIATMDLDLRSFMSVTGCTAGGVAATYTHVTNLLTVNLNRPYLTGETVTVTVTYNGNPSSGGSFGWDSYAGQPMIWSLSEPYGARDWWPCKDDNRDKPVTMDIRVTVPDNLLVASNGSLISDVDNGATRTFYWHTDYPIATYLVSVAAYPYTHYSDWYTPLGGGDPMEVSFFVFPDHLDDVQPTYALVVPMIEAFASGFGEYPFVNEKYGHAEFLWGGGMEHQTITSLGTWSEDVISHELAHSWWGDMITCADFSHVWLQEGFATWSEAYWKEKTEGIEMYRAYMDAAAYFGPGTIIVEDPLNDNIFSTNLSYNKASWVFHMLRGVVGDENFFAGLAAYRAAYGYGSATTEQFRDIFEAVSGQDLDAFFQQWIYGEYFPVYGCGWSQQPDGTIALTIEQRQSNTGLFTMPVPVRVVTDAGSFDFTVPNSQASQQYVLGPVAGTAQAVLLDPDKWILRQVETVVTNPTFADGILLVNGVDWDTYAPEIQNAYEARAFWGEYPITFWDCFPEPAGGYPSTLPPPAGHGEVPAYIIGNYSTVIWVGNDFNGDLTKWQGTPIKSYLDVGGNVLLMTRLGQGFIDNELAAYLGISWANDSATLANFVASYLGLVNIPFIGGQSFIDVFWPTVGPQSLLLFKDTAAFGSDRGVGVHAQPAGGGSENPDGAHFIYMACRPYRMNHAALRSDVEFMLANLFGELPDETSAGEPGAAEPARLTLGTSYPNPFNPRTLIPFSLPAAGRAELSIYDAAGRLVKVLVAGELPAGEHKIAWDGTDAKGREMASGVYHARLRAEGEDLARRMVLIR